MFRRTSDPLALSEASLLALRPAMNAPVLNVDFLPVGPARAAIVVFAEEWAGIGLAIGVRSNDGGQIAVFRNQEPIDASTSIVDALEPALAHAERMGFLFDDDIVEAQPGGKGRSQAMALWGDLMGELDPASASSVGAAPLEVETTAVEGLPVDASPDGPADDELLLDDLAEVDLPEISLELELDDALPPAAAATTASPAPPVPARAARQKLSKFRQAAAEEKADGREAQDEPQTGGSELGRIPLVRVRREGSRRVPFLARLLSSF